MRIEIGTCDFETQAGLTDGIFIEPVKFYFDRLPANCKKENVAVSNREGVLDMYYVPDAAIAQYKLASWLRGCNSLGVLHPRVQEAVASGSLPASEIASQPVPVVRLKTLLDKYQVQTIDVLKVDTEGHDVIILNDFLDTLASPELLPTRIFYENNGLIPAEDVHTLNVRLLELGYTIVDKQHDVEAVRL